MDEEKKDMKSQLDQQDQQAQKGFVVFVTPKGEIGIAQVQNMGEHEINGVILALATKVKERLNI